MRLRKKKLNVQLFIFRDFLRFAEFFLQFHFPLKYNIGAR